MVDVDGNGVKILYANNGNIKTFGPLGDNGGSRANLSNPPLNAEFTGFFGSGGDDNSAKLRGGRHSDSAKCDGCCYIPACPTGGGNPKFRTECPHPDYGGGSASNSGSCPSGGMGMKAIVWNTTNNCVHWEVWTSPGQSAPGNWSKVMSSDDCSGYGQLNNCGGGPLLKPRGSTSTFTWRCDGKPSSKWMTAVEISPGGAANPGGGGTAPPTGTPPPGGTGDPNNPSGDGGGGGGDDNNTGTGGGTFAFASKGCAIASAGGNTVQAGKCGGTGEDLLPDVAGGDGMGGATEPKPIITVYKDLALLYNIRVDLQDNCTIQGDLNVTNYEEVYSVSPAEGEYKAIFQNGIQYIGIKLHASSSELNKKRIRKVDVTMKRSEAVALTGDLKMQIRDRNGNLLEEFDTVIDPATVDLNDTTYSFFHNDNPYKLEAGDMIVLAYTNGGDTTNNILVAHMGTGSDAFDGFNTIYVESQSGIGWDTDQLSDACFKVYT